MFLLYFCFWTGKGLWQLLIKDTISVLDEVWIKGWSCFLLVCTNFLVRIALGYMKIETTGWWSLKKSRREGESQGDQKTKKGKKINNIYNIIVSDNKDHLIYAFWNTYVCFLNHSRRHHFIAFPYGQTQRYACSYIHMSCIFVYVSIIMCKFASFPSIVPLLS